MEGLEFLFVGEVELHGGSCIVTTTLINKGIRCLGVGNYPLFDIDYEVDRLFEVEFYLLGFFLLFAENLYE